MNIAEKALELACPACGAEPRGECHRIDGHVMPQPHSARRNLVLGIKPRNRRDDVNPSTGSNPAFRGIRTGSRRYKPKESLTRRPFSQVIRRKTVGLLFLSAQCAQNVPIRTKQDAPERRCNPEMGRPATGNPKFTSSCETVCECRNLGEMVYIPLRHGIHPVAEL